MIYNITYTLLIQYTSNISEPVNLNLVYSTRLSSTTVIVIEKAQLSYHIADDFTNKDITSHYNMLQVLLHLQFKPLLTHMASLDGNFLPTLL